MILTLLGLVVALVALIYLFLVWNFGYWKTRNVNGPKPTALFGNYPSVFTRKRHLIYDLNDIYRDYKKYEDFVGIFNSRSPQLLITNYELMHRVFVTDFKHFHDNEASLMIDEKSDFIFAHNPFILTGEKWKESRAELTPGLTINRIKSVYPVTLKVCNRMVDYIKKQIKMVSNGIEAKDLTLRFTSEVVTDCVLGLSAESFSDKPTPILQMTKRLFEQTIFFMLYQALIGIFPIVRNLYRIKIIPKRVEEFFLGLMENAVNTRRKLVENQNVDINERTDFLNYILQLQDKKNLNTKELTSRTMTFLLDGFETTAVALSHCLLMLGRNTSIQEKLRAELVKHQNASGFIDFDTLNDLPYLNACIHEALRLFPPAFMSNKFCTEPIELQSKSGRSVQLKKGDVVVLPLYAVMKDEDIYPNPEEFQPERFLPENGGVKKYRDMGAYYGFGDGPRTCIGMRFALAQVKAAIFIILKNFNVKVNPKTRTDNNLDPKYFISRLDGDIFLDFEVRN